MNRWLFLVTRMNAAMGDERDEFCFMWKQPQDEVSILFESKHRKIGLFHGHSSAFPNKVPDLVTLIQNSLTDTSPDFVLGILIHDDLIDWESLGTELGQLGNEFIDFLSERWSEYPLYENLASAVIQNNFDSAFDSIWERFAGDPVLETKLEILHLCLTPNGAVKMGNEAEQSGESLGPHVRQQMKDSAERLSKIPNPFDPDYIAELEKLRIELLDRETTKTTAAKPNA